MKIALLAAEKYIFTPEEHNDFLWAVAGSPWGLLAIWLALINLTTFCAFGLDKWKAKRKAKKESVRRVPEKTLFLLAALGGSVGALLGMLLFRHKIRKGPFRYGVPLMLAAQAWLALYAAGLP